MQTFTVKVGERTVRVRASALDVALKRFLGGGWDASYTYATVNPAYRFKMAVGQTIQIVVSREA